MQQLHYFEKILKNIVSDKDLSNLSLKKKMGLLLKKDL